MIIFVGPDGSGKTTCAQSLHLRNFHFTKDSEYADYLKPLVAGEFWDSVCDRYIFDEIIYSKVMHRQIRHTNKEIHNIMLTTLMCRPVIVLFTHKPDRSTYEKAQYLPFEHWEECMQTYRDVLHEQRLPFFEFDYESPFVDPSMFVFTANTRMKFSSWWFNTIKTGNFPIGSPHPKVLIVAERLGPNNANNIPFETGPTGFMLSDVIVKAKIPWYDIAVTNYVKDVRRSTRTPNDEDNRRLTEELEHLKPEKVLLMGAVANKAKSIVMSMNIPVINIPHLGSLRYSGITDLGPYSSYIRSFVYNERRKH